MMTLARAGIGLAVAGGIALAVHGMLLAKPRERHDGDLYGMLLARQAQLRSDCITWSAAEDAVQDAGDCPVKWINWKTYGPWIVKQALDDPNMEWLLRGRESLACRREFVSLLLPALRDPTLVGLAGEDAESVTVEGRNMPVPDYAVLVRDDLFTRAGRASWLLKQVTGHRAPIVGVQTDPRLLVDIFNDWRFWLAGMDGGRACSRAELWRQR